MLDRLTASIFRWLSSVRDERVFHPQGVAYEARFVPRAGPGVLADSPLLRGERDAIARFSRGVGLPAGVPDILGLAVKILDVYGTNLDQDVALASSGHTRLGRRVLVPRRDFATSSFSSILPYAVEGQHLLVMAELVGSGQRLPFSQLADGSHAALGVRLRLDPGDLLLGWIELGARLPAAAEQHLRFDPWHTGPDLRPAGLVNRLRRPTYQASQEGRDAPSRGVREHLDR